QCVQARERSLAGRASSRATDQAACHGVDMSLLNLPEEQALMKSLLQYPDLVAGAAPALEPHRVAYYLTELAGVFHPYYKAHRVITDDRRGTLARLGLGAAVGQVTWNRLGLLRGSAPESMSMASWGGGSRRAAVRGRAAG